MSTMLKFPVGFLTPSPVPTRTAIVAAGCDPVRYRAKPSHSTSTSLRSGLPATPKASLTDSEKPKSLNAFERANIYSRPKAVECDEDSATPSSPLRTADSNRGSHPNNSEAVHLLGELERSASFEPAHDVELLGVESASRLPYPEGPSGPGIEHAKDDGPPLQYDREALRRYWSGRSSELNQRYLAFAKRAGPFFATVLRHLATRTLTDEKVIGELAVMAREGMEDLGPTYVKIGQTLSIRPDIIPAPAMRELQKLQDGVRQFDSDIARALVEEELGDGLTLEDVYSEFSEEPIAAASLAQVYRARLRATGVEVAVKVQRPDALTLCSKDMYVLSRAVSVYQKITDQLTAQKVDYDALFENFAAGLYNELNFLCEADKQNTARSAVLESMGGRVYVPKVFFEYTSRRVLVTEFIYGKPLTGVSGDEMRRLISVGQECFLQQLLEPGRALHGDPHGGNVLKPDVVATAEAALVNERYRATYVDEVGEDQLKSIEADLLPNLNIEPDLYVLDWGLTCDIPDSDRPKLVLAIVHMANKDWAAVTEDFIALGFLPADTNRKKVAPILEKVLAPYVLDGGGAKAFIGDGVFSASFQDLVRDLSFAAVEIPFSIPAFYASASRSIAILEGLALVGDENYKIVLSAYPFVTRLLLEQNGDESLRAALNEILYPRDVSGERQPRPSPRRVIALLNSALGRAARGESGAMLDLDAIPDDAASLTESVAFLGTEKATAIRAILIEELVSASDLVLRSLSRQLAASLQRDINIPLPAPALPFLPKPNVAIPNLLNFIPENVRDSSLDRIAPPLTPEEDVFVGDIFELSRSVVGVDLQNIVSSVASPRQLLTSLGPAVMSALSRRNSTQSAGDRLGIDEDDPGSLVSELLDLLPRPNGIGANDGNEIARAAAEEIVLEVLGKLRSIQEERLGISSAASR